MPNQAMDTDYLAVIPIGGGSSWGRSPNKEEAISNAIRSLRDWMCLFDVANIKVTVNVIDVAGYTDCFWGSNNPDGWLHGTNRQTGEDEAIERPIEHIERTTPRWRRP